jgi:Fe2+ transport system protein FeoA
MSQQSDPEPLARLPLTFISPGEDVCLTAFGDQIDPVQREQLAAYGLTESRTIRVLQQRPMTIVVADEVELALEHAVASHIWVEKQSREA